MAKFIYYRYYDHPDLKENQSRAIDLYKNQMPEFIEDRIKIIPDPSGISVYEDETNTLIETRLNKDYSYELKDTFTQEYLKGSRHLERYSYFEISVSNFDGYNRNIKVKVNINEGKRYKESVTRNNGWGNHELYVSYIISGLKQKCAELKIANLIFEITDIEYNLSTSCHTSFYASQHFVEEYVKPNLVKKASA